MPTDLAELSSITSSLDQLARRVASMAETADRAREEDVASELYAVERSLSGATRRLTRFVERNS
jgi:hypothetical protein